MSPNDKSPEPRYVTRLESDDEVRQALQAHRARIAGRPAQAGPQAAPVKSTDQEAQVERPTSRPPTAMLCILDDGQSDGEWVRLRTDVTVIGRMEGDIKIPHDGLVSGKHAEIVRKREARGYRWVLSDLQSTNGTFLHIGSAVLRNDFEVIVGGGRYRFVAAGSSADIGPQAAAPESTQAWTASPVRSLVPALVEMSPSGPVSRIPLSLPEYWIGRNAKTCSIARVDDQLISSKHAKLYRDTDGKWHIENNKSVNGLWLRIAEPMPLAGPCQFRIGEQKFIFRPA